jgi:hypothetical protein
MMVVECTYQTFYTRVHFLKVVDDISYHLFCLLPVFQPMDSMQMPAQRAPGNYGDENGSRKRRGGKSNLLFDYLSQFGDCNYHARSS